MMNIRVILAAMAVVTLAAAFFGYRLGQEVAGLDEGETILRVADIYVSEVGGGADPTDCSAVPGRDGEWLSVRCSGAAGTFDFDVDRFGRITRAEPDLSI